MHTQTYARVPRRLRVARGEVDMLVATIGRQEIELEAFTLGTVAGERGGMLQVLLSDQALEDAHRLTGQVASVRVQIGRGGPRLPLRCVFLEPFIDAIAPESQAEGTPIAVVSLPFIRVWGGLASC